jgi:hypothetical protein
VTKAFRKYMDIFMKIFLDDFIVYSDMEIHAFMVCSKIIIGFIVSKEVKLFNPNKI